MADDTNTPPAAAAAEQPADDVSANAAAKQLADGGDHANDNGTAASDKAAAEVAIPLTTLAPADDLAAPVFKPHSDRKSYQLRALALKSIAAQRR